MAKLRESAPVSAGAHNILAAGTKLTGEISSEEDFRIDGTIEGNLTCNGKIIIGQNGFINGNIRCTNIDVYGHITGNISCDGTTILRASSLLEGEIKTQIIEIEPNARFIGSCSMKTDVALES